jgi:hypothetical protein
MKFEDSMKELQEQIDIAKTVDPAEGFARVLLHLYRDPKPGTAETLAQKMSKSYGRKTLQKLVERAQSVIDMIKGKVK